MPNLPNSLPVIADYDSALAISFGLNAVFGGWRGVYKVIVKRQRALAKEALHLDEILSAEIPLERIAMAKLKKSIGRGKWWRRRLWQVGRGIGFSSASAIYVALFHFAHEPVTALVWYSGMLVAYGSPGVMVAMMLAGWGFNRSATTQLAPLQERADEMYEADRQRYTNTLSRLRDFLNADPVRRRGHETT